MKTIVQRLLGVAGILILPMSCNPSQDADAGIQALGIHTTKVKAGEIGDIVIVRDVDGVRSEWIEGSTSEGDVAVHIELGLPGKTMRAAIGGNSSALVSGFEADFFTGNTFTFNTSTITEAGEYILLENKGDDVESRSKILLIAK